MQTRIQPLVWVSCVLIACNAAASAGVFPEVSFAANDRVLVLAPHPDDEVLGSGGAVQNALARKLPVRVAFLTYGDGNEWAFMIYRKHPVLTFDAARRMGLIRHEEALAAGKVLGLVPDQLTFLGYPDLGTLHIWTSHWEGQPPFHSALTSATSVPYTNAFRPGAPYRGEAILSDLATIIRDFRPTKIFVSHPADHHPDHRALYLFATVALWNLADELKPEVFPYLIHFKAWPEPKGWYPALPLEPPAALRDEIQWQQSLLTPEMADRNQRALQEHRTQYEYSSRRLLALIRANELFGALPPVVLRREARAATSGAITLGNTQQSPEALTPEEQASILAVDRCRVTLEKDRLLLAIDHSRRLTEDFELSVLVFGYRSDRSFGQMPKLQVNVSQLEMDVYDRDKRQPRTSVALEREPRRTIFRIPLELMGNPDRILLTARTFTGDIPIDWTSWRTLEFQDSAPDKAGNN